VDGTAALQLWSTVGLSSSARTIAAWYVRHMWSPVLYTIQLRAFVPDTVRAHARGATRTRSPPPARTHNSWTAAAHGATHARTYTHSTYRAHTAARAHHGLPRLCCGFRDACLKHWRANVVARRALSNPSPDNARTLHEGQALVFQQDSYRSQPGRYVTRLAGANVRQTHFVCCGCLTPPLFCRLTWLTTSAYTLATPFSRHSPQACCLPINTRRPPYIYAGLHIL